MSSAASSVGEQPNEHDEPLSQRLYRAIRGKIITGELQPGSRLRERELAEEFGVSRVPLREAFPQLEADGFISSSLRRGVSVTTLTLRDVDELFEARLGIEVYATRLAAARVANGADVDPLRSALAAADAALLTKDADVIAEANAVLHEEIVWLAGNSLLRTMMHSISGRYRWIFRMTFTPEAEADGDEHHAMFAAILAGDPDLAAAVAWTHIEHGRKPTLAYLEGRLPTGEG
ncbi:MAG TPA: GntR family transcriptional regulator [Marmoricola sp.]|nr:GntR family transcriptional regulator [Marmoricola sp.]